mmetsp:Transcript_22505/g.53091  ORF Transcript_22505/g.53091 Transcript_22505/m.53091 type:complete len:97 (+) Transcript_22505:99-389(+)
MPSAKHIPDPPTRPFTEYHVFSQLERNYILQTASDDQREITRDFRGIDDDAALRPARYQGIILPKNWQRKGSRAKKRSQRSSHGIISFLELTFQVD